MLSEMLYRPSAFLEQQIPILHKRYVALPLRTFNSLKRIGASLSVFIATRRGITSEQVKKVLASSYHAFKCANYGSKNSESNCTQVPKKLSSMKPTRPPHTLLGKLKTSRYLWPHFYSQIGTTRQSRYDNSSVISYGIELNAHPERFTAFHLQA